MKSSFMLRTLRTLCAVTLWIFAASMTGCAAPSLIAPDRPTPLPQTWSEPKEPSAKGYCSDVQKLLNEVADYFKTSPSPTTP